MFFYGLKNIWFLVFLSQQIGDKTWIWPDPTTHLIFEAGRLTTPLVIGKRLTQSGAKRCRVALDMGHLAQTLMDRELCTGKSVANGKCTEMSIKKTAMDKDHIDVGHFGY